ncbi:hypothetical protein [Halopseudomonas laoshanensis]|uniref:hypothetical protein n=1 Tax=Halopseudomonas laoshanensis TaxID=2268758 RepID=UPI0037370832
MDIQVGAFNPEEEKCCVQVRVWGDEDQASDIEARVWVDNIDSRSALYSSAKAEALEALKRAVAALELDAAKS